MSWTRRRTLKLRKMIQILCPTIQIPNRIQKKMTMLKKLHRTVTSILPVEEGRTGSCNGCGECCKLPYRCQFLKEKEDGSYSCGIYQVRPLNCRKFPRTPDDLSLVKENCGFSFEVVPVKVKKIKEASETA